MQQPYHSICYSEQYNEIQINTTQINKIIGYLFFEKSTLALQDSYMVTCRQSHRHLVRAALAAHQSVATPPRSVRLRSYFQHTSDAFLRGISHRRDNHMPLTKQLVVAWHRRLVEDSGRPSPINSAGPKFTFVDQKTT